MCLSSLQNGLKSNMMVKAAALYMVIIIALIIATLSISLLSVAFFYRVENQKQLRVIRLKRNLDSGMAILCSKSFESSDSTQTLDLFDKGEDSIALKKSDWGVFSLNTAKAFTWNDTLKRAFLSGFVFKDSSAVYLADENRPLSLSGETRITGNGEFPKAGLKQAYVDGNAYTGKELIKGKTANSTKDLPVLEDQLLKDLLGSFQKSGDELPAIDSLVNSFFEPTKYYKLSKDQTHLLNHSIKGNIVLISDTTLIISKSIQLSDVLIFAPGIVVEDGFKGNCQLFARDSIIIGESCSFAYPSFAGVFKPKDSKIQAKIAIGEESDFSGILLSFEHDRSDLQTLISTSEDCVVKGQIYATGYLKLEKKTTVHGKVYAKRFLMQTPSSIYENYLIDVLINRPLLSKYYLTSSLFKQASGVEKVLEWLQ
jgi:cytoskeletal protein CcmA (bactofilin family)